MTDDRLGLNLLAIFDWESLPDGIRDSLLQQTDGAPYRQVLLFGHGGTALWSHVRHQVDRDPDPIDDYAVGVAATFMDQQAPGADYRILYPADVCGSPLLALGELAGWHNPSPFLLGVNATWGSWFAYRALVVADSYLPTTPPMSEQSPCLGCPAPCISACPAGAVNHTAFDMNACAKHRLQSDSSCAETCLSRTACPVAEEHRYSDEQLCYHYRRSRETIRRWTAG